MLDIINSLSKEDLVKLGKKHKILGHLSNFTDPYVSMDELRLAIIKKIEDVYKKIAEYVPYFLGIVIFIIGIIIYNMIKVSIYSRRETIQSLQLIGATKLFIKLPFIFEAMLISIISVSLVFPTLILTSVGLNYLISTFTVYNAHLSVDPSLFLSLLLLVTLISILASQRAVSIFLK